MSNSDATGTKMDARWTPTWLEKRIGNRIFCEADFPFSPPSVCIWLRDDLIVILPTTKVKLPDKSCGHLDNRFPLYGSFRQRSKVAKMLEYLVAIIKPHAVQNHLKIIEMLKDAGFRVCGQRCVEITFDEAWYLCKDENGKISSDSAFVESKMQSLMGTALVLLVSHQFAFEAVRDTLGPEDPVEAVKFARQSIRAKFGEFAPFNAIYASENRAMANKEMQHFFPRFSDFHNGPLSDIGQERVEIDTYFREKMLPTLLDAFYEMCVAKPAEPIHFLSDYLLNNNPNRPKILKPGQYVFDPTNPKRDVGLETGNYNCGHKL